MSLTRNNIGENNEDDFYGHHPYLPVSSDTQSKHEPDPERGSLRGPNKAQITNLDIRYDPPTSNCELQPYVMLQDENCNSLFLEDLDELQYRQYRGTKRICSVSNCNKAAKMQCLSCAKYKAPPHLSYFCSSQHLKDMWPVHRELHYEKSLESDIQYPNAQNCDECEPISHSLYTDNDKHVNREKNQTSFSFQFALKKSEYDDGLERYGSLDSFTALSQRYPPLIANIQAECSQNRTYTPLSDDIGRQLLLECAPVIMSPNEGSQPEIGPQVRKNTSSIVPEPEPTPSRIFVRNPNIAASSISDPHNNFKVLCYNILAEIYATKQIYPYCPMRALCQNYRRNIIMRDISNYNCDIVCLQEVQQNHYEKYFVPLMSALGYEGIYKMKTRDVPEDERHRVDGCAIFYKKDRFAVMEQYVIEFNEAAKGLFENSVGDWRSKLRRLSKGNIALVCVLEELRSDNYGRNRRKRRICVANTHIYQDPSHADVKLQQTQILCKELQKMVLGRDLPLILCGDFNSTPDSAVYELLSTERLRDDHPVLIQDKLGIFNKTELTHDLPLVSSYATVFGNEPKHTNFTATFSGCLDYILYAKNHLQVVGVLDIDSEEILTESHALPSERIASDHLAVVAEFSFL